MADRVSTIRFKVDGTQEAVSSVEKLTQAIVRGQRAQADAMKVAAQKARGGDTAGAQDAVAVAVQENKQIARNREMLYKEEQVLATAHTNQVVAREEAETAIRQKEADKQEDAMNKRLLRQEAAQDAYQIRLQTKSAEMENRRVAREEAASERALRAQLKIEARAADARRDFYRQQRPGGGGESVGGALSGFGGKMVLAHAAGMAAGDIIGDQHGGRELGSVIGAAMFGGPQVAAAVAGIELIGAAFRANRESAEAARKSTQDYMNSLRELTSTWGGMSTSLIKETSFGDAMDKEMKRAKDSAVKNYEELAKLGREGPGLGDALQVAIHSKLLSPFSDLIGNGKAPGDTAFGQQTTSLIRQIKLERSAAEAAKTYRSGEAAAHGVDQQQMVSAELQLSQVAAMRPGLLKEEAELAAKINVEEVQRLATNRQQTAQAEAAVTQATIYNKIAQEQAKHPPAGANWAEVGAIKEAARAAQQSLDDAKAARARLPGEQGREGVEAKLRYSAARDSQQVQADMQMEEQAVKTAQAQVGATKDGYAKTAAVRDLAFAEEEKRAADHGAAMVQLVKDMHKAMRAEADKENRESIQAALAPFSAAAAGAVGGRNRADLKAKGASAEEIQTIDNGRYLLQIDEARVAAAAARRDITLQEAAIERALIGDKDPAHQKAIIAAVKAREEAANQEEIAQSDLSTKQSALDIAYEQHKLTTEEYEMQKEMAADRRAQENPEVAAALERRVAAEQEAATVKDVERYRQQARSTDLDYRVKMHQVTERDADIERMIMADRRAQEKGPQGDRIRKEIVALADAHEKLRDTQEINVGQGSSQYESGHVHLNSINRNHPYGFFRGGAIDHGGSSKYESNHTDLDRIAGILEDIKRLHLN